MKKLLITALAVLPALSLAIWTVRPENVPLDRLIRNVRGSIASQPKEAGNYYVLGRLHSLGFAKNTPNVEMAVPIRGDTGREGPQFLPWQSVMVKMEKAPATLTPKLKEHLMSSLANYRKSVQLDPEAALYHLGLAWMLELGSPYAAKVRPLKWDGKTARTPEAWREMALKHYRRAYNLRMTGDLQNGMGLGADAAISVEAGRSIIRLLSRNGGSAQDRAEMKQIEQNIQKIESLPRPVTPIIFSLSRPTTLDALLDPLAQVTFDLRGSGKSERWPWVAPDTAILVWDPTMKGKIDSGTQLFGSATWWMMWQDGYAPLRALDDDGDGFVSGHELRGLAVWQDTNGNGVSDRGEVRPVEACGIRWLCARPDADASLKMSGKGVGLIDGSVLPTYDWMPSPIR
jgi:hypothetical protein